MFEALTSSQLARLIQAALLVVAALVLVAAVLRVIEYPPPRRRPFAAAWLVSTLVLGALAIHLDSMVGITARGDRVLNGVGAAVLSAAGLAVGAWWTGRSWWRVQRQIIAVLSLVAIELVVAFLALSLR